MGVFQKALVMIFWLVYNQIKVIITQKFMSPRKKNFDSSLIGGRKKIISQRKFIGFQKNWYGWASLEQLRQSNLKEDIA